MAKTSGLGDNFYVAQYNLSGNVSALGNISGGPEPMDVTAIDKSAHERIAGKRSGQMEFTTFFDKAAGAEHPALSTLPTTDRVMSYLRGTAIGNPAASMVAKQINYDGNRGDDGSLTFNVQALSNGYGLEWGLQGTPGLRTDTGATAGSALDSGAATTNFGLQAYLHVTAFSGTDVTIKLQESSDNGADTYADVVGGAFTSVTGVTSERIATATDLAVERYLKVTTATTGGFTSVSFVVVIVRNQAAPAF